MTVNFAHRGASGCYPENTMLSFKKAIEMGCTGIETDVQMTRDGSLILMHDERVDRTTNGTGFVKDYTFEEIRKLDAGGFFSKEFIGEKVPAIEELIELVKDKDIIINFEIKSGIIIYDKIEEKLIDTIYKYGIEKKVILSSFNHYSMVMCKRLSKEIKTGLLYMEGIYRPERYCRFVGADALHPYFYTLRKEIIDEIKREKVMINTFTVNEEKYMKYLLKEKVDGIITNYPDKLKKLMEESHE